MIDLEPAARRMIDLLDGVPDDALDRPTPCAEFAVGDLIDHIGTFAIGFHGAAIKEPVGAPPPAARANLERGWRDLIRRDLLRLVDDWREPAAWEGMTAAGGVDIPGDVAGAVALDELVIHGWDLGRATGQPAGYDGPDLEAVQRVVEQFMGAGIFGPTVPVPADGPRFDRILGLTGRDPAWTPPA